MEEKLCLVRDWNELNLFFNETGGQSFPLISDLNISSIKRGHSHKQLLKGQETKLKGDNSSSQKIKKNINSPTSKTRNREGSSQFASSSCLRLIVSQENGTKIYDQEVSFVREKDSEQSDSQLNDDEIDILKKIEAPENLPQYIESQKKYNNSKEFLTDNLGEFTNSNVNLNENEGNDPPSSDYISVQEKLHPDEEIFIKIIEDTKPMNPTFQTSTELQSQISVQKLQQNNWSCSQDNCYIF